MANLRKLRQERSLTQAMLADFLGVSPNIISNYENGVYYPNVRILIKVADYFKTSTDYLLGRVEK